MDTSLPASATSRPTGRAVLPAVFTVGAQAALLSWCLAAAFWGLSLLVWDNPSASVVIVVACATSVLICARTGRGRPGTVRLAAYAQLGWAPYLYSGCAIALNVPLIAVRTRSGTSFDAVIAHDALPICALPLLFGAAIVLAAFTERLRVSALTPLAAGMLTAAAIGVLASAVRVVDRPEPDAYVDSLPTPVALLRDNARFQGAGFTVEQKVTGYVGWLEGSGAPGCKVYVDGVPMDSHEASLASSCDGVLVAHDEANGVWVIEPPGGVPFAIATEVRPHRVQVTARRVAASLRPPTAWIGLLASGCLAAIVAIGIGLMMLRGGKPWREARRGVHEGGGWIVFDDGSPPLHLSEAAALPAGRVLVLAEAGLGAPTYRKDGRRPGGARVVAGTIADVDGAAEARASGAFAFAIAITLLALAPMLAAAAAGLLRA